VPTIIPTNGSWCAAIPIVAEERCRKREDLLTAAEAYLHRSPCTLPPERFAGTQQSAWPSAPWPISSKLRSTSILPSTTDALLSRAKSEQIAAEAALDGIYILRTTVDSQAFSTSDVIRSSKQLARVERAFRTLNSIDLEIRPIYHYREDRVRAHVLLAMLAYYVEWHLREAWAELLFIDEQTPSGTIR
jgi:hypothetical protein